MSSPIAVESDAIPTTPLRWTERDLEEMNITILDMPTTQIADPASLRSHLSWGRTRDGDTTDIADTGRSAWYNDFCFLLVERLMEEGLETTDGGPAHVAWTTEALELHGPCGTTKVQADFIFSLAGITSLAYATPECLPDADEPADEMGYYVAILVAMAQHVAAEVGEQSSYSARLLCPSEEVGRFVFLSVDVPHVFLENMQNGCPQVETLCIHHEVVEEGVDLDGRADFDEGMDVEDGDYLSDGASLSDEVSLADSIDRAELFQIEDEVHGGQEASTPTEDGVDITEKINEVTNTATLRPRRMLPRRP